jgi:hypothetical protein
MAEKKLTAETWTQARKEWETSASASYASIAAKYLISKALVGQESKRAGWVKSAYADKSTPKHGVDAGSENLHSSRHRSALPSTLDVQVPKNGGHNAVPAVPAGDQPVDGDAMPAGLTFEEEALWIERQVVVRQTALNRKHAKELSAAKATLYGAIKNAAGKDGFNLARTARQIVASMTEQHASEMANEAGRVRLELGAYHGAQGPRPCVIRVLIVPGMKIGESSPEPPAGSRAVPAKDLAHAIQLMRDGDVTDVVSREVRDVD